MNIFELKLWDDECKKCTFYTIHLDGASDNLTDKFIKRFEKDIKHKESLQLLLSFILDIIGNEYGANDLLLNRFENNVVGLPSKGKVKIKEICYNYPNFPLRIYALKITDEIMILFGGGIKDANSNQKSSLHVNWIEACKYADKIIKAIQDKDILIDENNRRLLNSNFEEDIVL